MDLDLAGKRALVTGSSAGIGVGIAEMLVDEGVSVVVNGRNEERTLAVAAKAREAFGGIDILVNNAGGAAETASKSWFGASTADWAATYEGNVLAAVRLIHELVPAMKEQGWGRVINIGTGASITPTSGQADYGPSKAAQLNMTLGLSKALSRTGVTCNTVSPGMIRTEGLERFLRAFAEKRGWGDDIGKAEQYIVDGGGQTVSKVGEVKDIAYFVTMLASPNSAFINGANLHVDGGISPAIH
jgi:3-oxoacyl-[acyl-carrier protein] reductase